MNDGFALAEAGLLETWSVLELATYYTNEEDYTVGFALARAVKNFVSIWRKHTSPNFVS